MPHRQAYFPRMWPGVVATIVVAEAVQLITAAVLGLDGPMRLFVGIIAGLTVGFGVSHWRIRRWRRQHPEVGLFGYLEAQRRNAPWN